MAKVDPFLVPLPKKLRDDPDLRPFYEYLVKFLHDLWSRTGGGTDLVEDTEAAVTSQDGGNRSTRFQRDEIDRLWSHIDQVKQKDYRDDIQSLQDQLADTKRAMRSYENMVSDLADQLSSLKTKHQNSNQNLFELTDLVNQFKSRSRTTEHNLNELTERLDSGT